jgi:hypothetical protein
MGANCSSHLGLDGAVRVLQDKLKLGYSATDEQQQQRLQPNADQKSTETQPNYPNEGNRSDAPNLVTSVNPRPPGNPRPPISKRSSKKTPEEAAAEATAAEERKKQREEEKRRAFR